MWSVECGVWELAVNSKTVLVGVPSLTSLSRRHFLTVDGGSQYCVLTYSVGRAETHGRSGEAVRAMG
jgi:hypothetical protein